MTESKEDGLLPCPFCGGVPMLREPNMALLEWQLVWVECSSCGVQGEQFDCHVADTEDPIETVVVWAKAAWNRRASSPPVGGSGEVVALDRETIARAIYETDPHYESGEYVDSFPVSPGGTLTWEQALARDAEFAGDRIMLPITKFAFDAADRIRSALAAPVPDGGPEGAKPDYWALWSPSGMHIGLWSERKLAETAAEGFSAGYRIQPLYASPVTPEGLSGGDPKWPAYVPQVIEYEEGGYAQLLLEDAAVIHAEEMTVTVLRRMSSPEREILGFQWEIPFKEHG